MTKELDEILKERGAAYGRFDSLAVCARGMKETFHSCADINHRMDSLTPLQRATVEEGADMIIHKLSRLANGDPLDLDTWRDIAGYANTVINILELKV